MATFTGSEGTNTIAYATQHIRLLNAIKEKQMIQTNKGNNYEQ